MNDLNKITEDTLFDLNLYIGNYVEKYQHMSLEEFGKYCYVFFLRENDQFGDHPQNIITNYIGRKIFDITDVLREHRQNEYKFLIYSKELYALIGEYIFDLKDEEKILFSEYMYMRENMIKNTLDYIDPTTFITNQDFIAESLFSQQRSSRFGLKTKEINFSLFEFKDHIAYNSYIGFRLRMKNLQYKKIFYEVTNYLIEQTKINQKIHFILKENKFEQEEYFEKTNHFSDLNRWADELNAKVQSFKAEFGHFPNIMLANSITYSRIDLVANTKPKNIRGKKNDVPENFVGLSGFNGEGYSLDWCVEEELSDLEFILIFDTDPDGGLPLPQSGKKQKAV